MPSGAPHGRVDSHYHAKFNFNNFGGIWACKLFANLCHIDIKPGADIHGSLNTGDQVNVLPEGEVPSAELNTVQESKRLRQLQKAQNAKENDEYGGAITLIAMVIVISALLILSILFFCFGKISTAFQKSRKRMAHGVEAHNAEEHHEELDSGEAIAAIAMALAEHTVKGTTCRIRYSQYAECVRLTRHGTQKFTTCVQCLSTHRLAVHATLKNNRAVLIRQKIQ